MTSLLLVILLVLGWPTAPQAQVAAVLKPVATAPAAPVLSPAQAQAALDVLQNDAKRAQFIGVLQSIAKVQAATAPKAAGIPLTPGSLGAELLAATSGMVGRASDEALKTVQTLIHLPHLVSWLSRTFADEGNQQLVIAIGWKLALIAFAAGLAHWLAWRLLARWRGALHGLGLPDPRPDPRPDAADDQRPEQRASMSADLANLLADPPESTVAPARPSSWGLLRRLPYSLLLLLLDLTPVAAAALLAYAILATPIGAEPRARLALLGIVNAALLFQAVQAVARMILAPAAIGLRLVHVSNASANYLIRWTARFSLVIVLGTTIDQVGLLFGMDATVRDTVIKLTALVVHVMALVVVLQCRARVSRRMRAPRGARGAWAMVRNRAAELWHVVAIFYFVALWLIFAFEVHNGYALVWRYFLTLAITLGLARLIGIVLLGALDGVLHLRPDTASGHALLDVEAGRTHPALRGIVNGLIAVAALGVLLHFWGVPVLPLLRGGSLGSRIARAVGMSVLIVLLAFAIWEAANASIARHLARLARDAQLARSARLRTLLPMLRTTLLVVIVTFVGLMVLNEIGVNTAPLLAGAGVIGIAIGFGSQKLVQDVITGLFLLLENAMQVGDWVSLGGLSGSVENLSIRTIRLRALDGAVHVIPFSAVTTVTNATRDYGYAVLDVTAGYNEEPDHIASILRSVFDELRRDPVWAGACEGEIDIQGVDRFLDNAWVMRARVKTTPAQRLPVQREFNRRLKYRFDECAIESPFTSPRILSTVPGPPPGPVEEPAAGPARAA